MYIVREKIDSITKHLRTTDESSENYSWQPIIINVIFNPISPELPKSV
jgi:hypothetical protein